MVLIKALEASRSPYARLSKKKSIISLLSNSLDIHHILLCQTVTLFLCEQGAFGKEAPCVVIASQAEQDSKACIDLLIVG